MNKQKIIEKQEEYIAYLIKAIKSESILEAITLGIRNQYESELSSLKAEAKFALKAHRDNLIKKG